MAKLMLVEDDNNLREIYEARLQAEGYTIVTARDGEEALVVAKAEKPDLIISDVMMPKISGFEMLDILRNTEGLKEVKVIMLTALGQTDDQQRADSLGADRYLVKSQVTHEDIVKAAHELLGDAAAPTDTPEPDPTPEAPAAPAPAPAAAATPEPPAQLEPALAEPPVQPEPAVQPEPVTPTPAAIPISDTPALVIDEPADDSQAATTDTPAPAPTDSDASAQTPVSDTAQSISQEEAAVESQIEDFIASVPGADATASTPEDTPSGVPQPINPESTEPEEDLNQNVAVAGKKVIQPLSDTAKPDLEALVAAEEAKEAATTPSAETPPTAVIASNETPPTEQPLQPPAEQQPQATDFASKKTDKPVDPDSIAL